MANVPLYIGVATTVEPKWRQTREGRVRRPTLQFVRLAEAAQQEGAVLYLFHPRTQWDRDGITGWIPELAGQSRRNWTKRKLPLPDVIYENVFVHLAIKGYTSDLRLAAKRHRIPLFNPVLPGKWRMIKLLKQSGLSAYTPATERLTHVSQAIAKCQEWHIAYIKPVGGYGGMDVSRVEVLGNGRYRVSVDRTRLGQQRQRLNFSEGELRNWLARKTRRPHLIQRGLRLLTIGERRVDFRVVVHRDRSGHWQLIGIVPKMAAKDGVVTNIIAGGERLDVERLAQLAAAEGKWIPWQLLERTAKEIAVQLSNRYPSVGLIGFDMAVEENGQVSMIEMNPKPARSLLTQPMLERLAVHTVGFSLFLAGLPR